jgi:cell division transport system ATP-binding protein
MKTTLLKVENLSKAYVPGEFVWQNVQFDLGRGDFLYILGGSGAGKSSLLRALSSLESPTGGTIQYHGQDLAKMGGSTLQKIRKRMAFIPQNLGLIPDLTVRDHIEMSRLNLPKEDLTDERTMEGFLQLTGLTRKLDQRIASLSGGERQRVAILRALSKRCELLIADEPTGAQDFEMTWKLMDLFVKLNLSGVALLLATHDLEMVRRLRKRCAILKDGGFRVEERT